MTLPNSTSLPAVTVVYAGGPAPFPLIYQYTSPIHELGTVVAFGPVTWSLRQAPLPTAATIQMRSCDTAVACATEPWTTVTFGASPAIPPRRFAQYTIEIVTDGNHPTALDWIALDYSAHPDAP